MNVGIIGAGVIGSAIAKALIASSFVEVVIVSDKLAARLSDLEKIGAKVSMDNKLVAKRSDAIIISVKPNNVGEVLEEVRNEAGEKLIISVAAGVRLKFLKKIVPEGRFIRAMPNIGVTMRQSFTAYCVDEDVGPREREIAEKILSVFGRVVQVEERYMDVVTALSGCSPAYLSMIVDAMVDAAEQFGLSRDLALNSLAQTMIGTGMLILEGGKSPSEIISMVATPGGVTEEGLNVLKRYPVKEALAKTIEVGVRKAQALSLSLGE
ncbi:MAG: pyrroline-5-carboxylate reductase [Nitrososphaerota archaeon]|nr:pyrroline-5-carboxylate reductase [Candidatus Bathyarchaeota archaeon]MDW8048742.1 pyrroline-5-carboxylate reductase [Nitrososphaerota archaeon]